MSSNRDTASQRIAGHKKVMFDRFEVKTILGEGAAGCVYKVFDRNTEKEVALKVLTHADAFDEHTVKRFVEEVNISQQLKHPNLAQAYEFISTDESIAYTLEYVEGKDLGEVLDEGPLQYKQIDKIFKQLLSALFFLHEHDILHRDLKLENIMIRNDGVAKLTDFGLIKNKNKAKLTRTGVLLGTAQYMPPEYIQKGEYTHKSDLYAAGIVLYELLTGERRLSDLAGNEVIEYVIRNKFRIPVLKIAGAPEKYQYIIDKAMAQDPADRFSSAKEMLRVFNEKIDSRELTLTQTKSRKANNIFSKIPWKPLAVSAGVSMLAALAGFLVFSGPSLKNITNGSYVGEFSSKEQNVKEPLTVLVGEEQYAFMGDFKHCSNVYYKPGRSAAKCGKKDYKVSINKVSENSFSGKINEFDFSVSK